MLFKAKQCQEFLQFTYWNTVSPLVCYRLALPPLEVPIFSPVNVLFCTEDQLVPTKRPWNMGSMAILVLWVSEVITIHESR